MIIALWCAVAILSMFVIFLIIDVQNLKDGGVKSSRLSQIESKLEAAQSHICHVDRAVFNDGDGLGLQGQITRLNEQVERLEHWKHVVQGCREVEDPEYD